MGENTANVLLRASHSKEDGLSEKIEGQDLFVDYG